MLGTISAVLTTTTVNVAIPDIMGAFGIGQDRAQWLSTGALAAMTVGMLLNAWLIGRYGQRRTFIGALCVFIVALLVAGTAPNETVLIGCRIVQGAVAGILQPLSMYTLFRVFPAAPARHRDGLLRDERHTRSRARADARRRHDRALQLALHFLRRRAGRGVGGPAR